MANEVISGTDLFVFVSSVPVAHATSHNLSIKIATRGTSDKETGLWDTKALGRGDVTASCEGLVAYGSFETIVTQLIARAPLLVVFGRKNTGADTPCTSATFASGYFYITSWDETAPDAGNTTYTVTFDHCSGFAFTSGSA
jgi:hypothetical protein